MWCPNWRQCTDDERAAYCIPSNVCYGAVRGRSAPCVFCQQPEPRIHVSDLQWQTSQISSPEETEELRQDVRRLILNEERHPQVRRFVTHQGFDAQRFVAICTLDAQNLYGLCYCRILTLIRSSLIRCPQLTGTRRAHTLTSPLHCLSSSPRGASTA